jgi:hypothetical protein
MTKSKTEPKLGTLDVSQTIDTVPVQAGGSWSYKRKVIYVLDIRAAITSKKLHCIFCSA